jgi:HSP20 family protein
MTMFPEFWIEIGAEPDSLPPLARGAAGHSEGWVPAVDIFETEAELVLLMDVPGVEKGDVDAQLSGDVLTIRGQKRFTGGSAEERYYRAECAYGPFERSFAIRSPIDRGAIKASLADGVLRVVLPKAGRESRRIPVQPTQG